MESIKESLSTTKDRVAFLLTPFKNRTQELHCSVEYCSETKSYLLTTTGSNQVLMQGFKRRDGLKMLAPYSNYTIQVCAGKMQNHLLYENQLRKQGLMIPHQQNNGLRIAKVRANDMIGSQYSIYECHEGEDPNYVKKKELAMIYFSCVREIYNRRRAELILPKEITDCKQPYKREEFLISRYQRKDPSVVHLHSIIPKPLSAQLEKTISGKDNISESGIPIGFQDFVLPPVSTSHKMQLPNVSDFGGLATSNSIKNILLLEPQSLNDFKSEQISLNEVQVSFVFAKASKNKFHLIVKAPLSPVIAFGMCLANLDSRMRPKINS